MQEKQVTLGKETFDLPQPFLVWPQNPIEQEGTYLLPEAQVDRFMFKLKVGYPTMDEEHIVMQRMAGPQPTLTVDPVLTIDTLMELQEQLGKVFIDPKVERHILRIVDATRNPKYDLDIGRYLRFGASPRAAFTFHWGHAGKHSCADATTLPTRRERCCPRYIAPPYRHFVSCGGRRPKLRRSTRHPTQAGADH